MARVRFCPQHDEPLDARGRCRECYRADDELARQSADELHLWWSR